MIYLPSFRACAACLMLFALPLLAKGDEPERKVQGNIITSDRDPQIQIQLPSFVRYAGGDRFMLYEIADCELHAFVKADAQRSVQRLYWVQFEQYLPSKPDLHHKYDSPRHAVIGGLDFYVDTWVTTADHKKKPGSDSEHIEALITRAGYKLPTESMAVRLVHLLDEAKRKELMIIYGEDLGATGFHADDLRKGGKAYDRWPMLEEEVLQRATATIVLTR